MRLILRIALCCSLTAGVGVAQRGGGGGSHGGGGGFHGGGGFTGGGHSSMGGSAYRGGTVGGMGGGVYRGGTVGGYGGGVYRGGYGGGVYRGGGGIYRGIGGYRGYGYRGYYGGYYSPYYYGAYGLGFGLGYGYGYGWPWYSDYGYNSYPAYAAYPADYSYPAYQSYSGYQQSPNVTVVYPPQASAPAPNTVYVERSVTREYDQYGQEINRPAAPANSAPAVYLIAFRDHTIRAAAAYWAVGGTLHYVTLDHEEKLAPLSTVDRDLSGQLNRERRVAFSLPASQ